MTSESKMTGKQEESPGPENLDRSRWATKYGRNELGLRDTNAAALRELQAAMPGEGIKEKSIEMEEVLRTGAGRKKYAGRDGGETAKELVKGGKSITPEIMKRALRWFADNWIKMPPAAHRASTTFQELQMGRFRRKPLEDYDAAIGRLTQKMLVEAGKTPDPKFARHEIGERLRKHIPADAHEIIVLGPRLKSY